MKARANNGPTIVSRFVLHHDGVPMPWRLFEDEEADRNDNFEASGGAVSTFDGLGPTRPPLALPPTGNPPLILPLEIAMIIPRRGTTFFFLRFRVVKLLC